MKPFPKMFGGNQSSKTFSQAQHLAIQAVTGSIERDQTCHISIIALDHSIRIVEMVEERLKIMGGSFHEGLWSGAFEGRRWSVVIEKVVV